MSNQSIIENYEYILLHRNDDRYTLIDKKKTLQIYIDDGKVKDGDIVIKVTKENIQVAKLIHKITLEEHETHNQSN